MPLCAVHLLALSTSIPSFLTALTQPPLSIQPLVAAKVIRWIITPQSTTLDALLKPYHPFDLLLILPSTDPLPADLERAHVRHKYSFAAGVPSRIVSSFASTNKALLQPSANDVPPLTGALDDPLVAESSQNLEYTHAFGRWATQVYDPHADRGAVSMLNLLAFPPGPAHDPALQSYQVYGRAFADSIGKRRGGLAKIVGKIPADKRGDAVGWDELALAHYPSIRHFADMAASRDYQAVNKKQRVGSLRDTCILMTSEVAVLEEMKGRVWARM